MWLSHLPVTPGHEFCAEVAAVGENVTSVTEGDRVVVDSRVYCGVCDNCQAGKNNLCNQLGFVGEVCDGAFAEWSLQPAHRLIRVPDGVPATVAALAEPLGVALRVVNRVRPVKGEPILVAGGGTIGGLVALLLADQGMGPVLLVERHEARSQLLSKVCGVQPVALDADEIIRAAGRLPRLAVEATGSGEVLQSLIDCIASGSRIAMVGLFHGNAALDVNALVEREIDLVGCSVFRDEQHQAVALLPRLSSRLAQLMEAPIELESVPERYTSLIQEGSDRLKSIVVATKGDSR